MFIFDVTNPLTLTLLTVMVVLLIFLGKETKKTYVPAFSLAFFLILSIVHSLQLVYGSYTNVGEDMFSLIMRCIGIDVIMIFITFFSYLWIDDIACRFYKKKSVDNSLDWFWKNV